MTDRRPALAKAKKPWYRKRNIVLLLVVAMAAWLGWGVYRAVTARPGVPVSYTRKQYELAASHQPGKEGDPNAWDSLLAADAVLTRFENELKAATGNPDEPPADWPAAWSFPYDYSAIRDPAAPDVVVEPTLRVMDLARDAGLHERLAEMAARPRALRPPAQEARVLDVMLPELGRIRNLARLCAGRMYLAHSAGDGAEQVAAFEQLLALARVAASQPLLIDRLVGIAVISLALSELRGEMADEPLPPEVCRDVLAAMERQLPGIPPIGMQIDGERMMVLDAIQWTHTDDGRGSGRLILTELRKLEAGTMGGQAPGGGLMSHPVVNIAGIFFPSRATVTAKANGLFDSMRAYSGASYAEREVMGFSFDAEVEGLPRGYILLRLLLPAFGKALSSEDQVRMEINGTRLILALRLYHLDHGEYPARLDDLVPSLLQGLPIDPVCGKPYGYRRLKPEEDPNGWGYIVYSFGKDGEDNGGTEDPKGQYTAMRPYGKGYDFIINVAPRGR